MPRALLKIILAATLLLAVAIGLIRAQAHDNNDVRAFLTAPEGCAAPCWQGIRPGVTRVADALALLREHEWIAAVEPGVGESQRLHWSGAQPDFIDGDEPGILLAQDGVVSRVRIATHLAFSEVWLAFGPPQAGSFLCVRRAFPRPLVHFAAFEAGFTARFLIDKPLTCSETIPPTMPCSVGIVPAFWTRPTDILIGPVIAPFYEYGQIRSLRSPFCF